MQLTRGLLILTPAEYEKSEGGLQIKSKKGGSTPATFSLPQIFELNESLKDHPYEKSEELAAFVKRCAESVSMELGDIFLCIEDEDVLITKEYKHAPSKDKLLRTFAQVEAEAVLRQEVSKYTILNFEYGQQYGKSSKNEDVSASLFAMNTGILTDIRANFEAAGLRVAKVTPPIAGLLYTSKMDINSATRAIALISMDFAATRLVVLHNGAPVFQQSFSGILEDIAELFMLEFGVSKLGAIDLIRQEGLGVCNKCNSAATRKQTMAMLDNAAGEILRNLRMVISTMKLDIDQIILSDALAKLPNIGAYCRQVGLTAPMENITNLYSGGSQPPIAADSAKQRGFDATSFVTFNGVLTMPVTEANMILGETNLLSTMKGKDSHKLGNFITGVVALGAVAYMGLVGAWWGALELQKNSDANELSNPNFKKAQQLIDDEKQYTDALANLEVDLQTLPQTQYKTSTVLTNFREQIIDTTLNLRSYNYINTLGQFSTNVNLESFDAFIDFKNNVNDAGYFKMTDAYSVSKSTIGSAENAQQTVSSGITLTLTDQAIADGSVEMQEALRVKAENAEKNADDGNDKKNGSDTSKTESSGGNKAESGADSSSSDASQA